MDGSQLGTATVQRSVLTKQSQLRRCRRLLNVPDKQHYCRQLQIDGMVSKTKIASSFVVRREYFFSGI